MNCDGGEGNKERNWIVSHQTKGWEGGEGERRRGWRRKGREVEGVGERWRGWRRKGREVEGWRWKGREVEGVEEEGERGERGRRRKGIEKEGTEEEGERGERGRRGERWGKEGEEEEQPYLNQQIMPRVNCFVVLTNPSFGLWDIKPTTRLVKREACCLNPTTSPQDWHIE
jgi:hypothetical protein